MNKLLLDEEPLVIIPSLAVAIGLNEAIVLQQLHYWIKKSNHIKDGRPWVYNTIPDWAEQFPFWGEKTVRRTFDSLVNMHIVLKGNYNEKKTDRTTWYSIDYAKFREITSKAPKRTAKKQKPKKEIANGQSDQMEKDKMTESNGQVDHLQEDKMGRSIPENTTEITSEKDRLIESGNTRESSSQPNTESDGMPTSVPGTAQEEISLPDWLGRIEEKYVPLRGKYMNDKDYQTAVQLIKSGIPLQTILDGIDTTFENKKKSQDNDWNEIRSLAYCAKAIQQLHNERTARAKAREELEQFVIDDPPVEREAAVTTEPAQADPQMDEEMKRLLEQMKGGKET
jgi:hypothetical protein